MLAKIAAIAFGAFLIWQLYKYVQANPQSLSKESLTKSFGSMGILGIALIVFISVVVMLLRRG